MDVLRNGKSDKKRPAAAVITLSDYTECPRRAVRSVLASPELFSQLHLVAYQWNGQSELYEGWADDKRALEAQGVHVVPHFTTKLDAERVKPLLVVHIPPHVRVNRGPLEALVRQAGEKYGRGCCGRLTESNSQMHFTLRGSTAFNTPRDASWLGALWAALAYGFLTAMALFDWARERYTLGTRASVVHDVRAQCVVRTFGRQSLAPETPWWMPPALNRSVAPAQYIQGTAILGVPSAQERGWRYVLWYFYRHAHLSLLRGVFWVPCFMAYYLIFTGPLWAPLLGSLGWMSARFASPFHPIWVGIYLVHALASLMAANARWNVPWQPLHALVSPIYLAALPAVITVARLHVPRPEPDEE